MRLNRLLATIFVAAATMSGACAHTPAPRMAPQPAGSCRSDLARWYAPEDADERARLNLWCAGVGPMAVLSGAAAQDQAVPLSDVTFVSWNVHVGNGDVRAFVDDLRAGRLTNGRVPQHFVLLLQEAVRTAGVPAHATRTKGARRIRAPHQDAADIDALARSLGLWMVYAPSMRNGNGAQDPPTDRGSAILSTLPLSNPMAVELPLRRQRRVALFADVALSQADTLHAGVLHLDALNSRRRFWVFGSGGWRATQARSLESLLPGGSLVLGADLNTWTGGGEPAPEYFRQLFGGTPAIAEGSERRGRVLDYLFFRGTGLATKQYREVANKYGSDHHPLIGWFNN